MAASYKKLFKLLIDREMKRKELAAKAGISPAKLFRIQKMNFVPTSQKPNKNKIAVTYAVALRNADVEVILNEIQATMRLSRSRCSICTSNLHIK